ncbi:aromatic ring-hydroxylating dioxygenase subunit alpha, partial [Streptomyces sp. NPDC056728]
MTTTPIAPSLMATLPGHYYTDPEIFRQEQERIFESMWFCAVQSADLDKPGAFRTVQVGRENVLITRSRTGELRAFLNVCRHRGARLCTEESGQVRRNLQCPYHAWTYDLDGKLIAAPNLVQMPDVDRTQYGLVKVALREWLGYAWVCLAEEPPSFEETVIGAAVERLGDTASIERYHTQDLALGKRISY